MKEIEDVGKEVPFDDPLEFGEGDAVLLDVGATWTLGTALTVGNIEYDWDTEGDGEALLVCDCAGADTDGDNDCVDDGEAGTTELMGDAGIEEKGVGDTGAEVEEVGEVGIEGEGVAEIVIEKEGVGDIRAEIEGMGEATGVLEPEGEGRNTDQEGVEEVDDKGAAVTAAPWVQSELDDSASTKVDIQSTDSSLKRLSVPVNQFFHEPGGDMGGV